MALLDLVRKLPYDHPYRWDGRTFGKPRLWTPALLTTLGWFDAYDLSTIVESSGFVSQWNDKSGNGRHLTQGTGSAQPTTGTRTLNGYNVLDFDGGDFLVKTSFPTPVSFSVFMVSIIDSVANASDGMWSALASKDIGFVANNASQFNGSIVCVGASNPANTPLSGGPFPGPSIYQVSTNTSGLRIRGWVDGVMRANVGYIGGISGSATFRVFADRSGTYMPNGAVAEVIAMATPVTAVQQQIEGYLAWKWDLVANLDALHPYKNTPPVG